MAVAHQNLQITESALSEDLVDANLPESQRAPRIEIVRKHGPMSIFARTWHALNKCYDDPEIVAYDSDREYENTLPARHSAQEEPEHDQIKMPPLFIVDGVEYISAADAVDALEGDALVEFIDCEHITPCLTASEISFIGQHSLGSLRHYADGYEIAGCVLGQDRIWRNGRSEHLFLEDAIRSTEKAFPSSTYWEESDAEWCKQFLNNGEL